MEPNYKSIQVNNYLKYTVTPVIDVISQPSLAQTHLDGETQFEAATNTPVGITMTLRLVRYLAIHLL